MDGNEIMNYKKENNKKGNLVADENCKSLENVGQSSRTYDILIHTVYFY